VALRGGGNGFCPTTPWLGQTKLTPKVATPLVHEGRLYWVDNRGVATCIDAKTGKTLYKERLEVRGRGDKVYASPVLAGGKLFVPTREDGTIVLGAGPEFHEVGRNRLDDSSVFNATPAVAGDRLLLRSNRFLYCLGK
jgi:outer membrane protein assembly factor BamB